MPAKVGVVEMREPSTAFPSAAEAGRRQTPPRVGIAKMLQLSMALPVHAIGGWI
jgi:hypothetical protein